MADRKTLVVYYSRTGHTEAAARDIARQTEAEIEAIDAGSFAHGFLWYLRAGWASVRREVSIAAAKHDPRKFKRVVLAGPVWAGRPAPPMRAYLRNHEGKLPEIAFVLTHGGGDISRAFDILQELAGKAPVAQVSLSEAERKDGREQSKIDDFVASLSSERQADAA